jgi:hypothetical protein
MRRRERVVRVREGCGKVAYTRSDQGGIPRLPLPTEISIFNELCSTFNGPCSIFNGLCSILDELW